MKSVQWLLLLVMALTPPVWAADTHDHEQGGDASEAKHGDEAEHEDEAGHGHDEEEAAVMLAPEAAAMAGVQVEPLAPRNLAVEIRAPGEVRLNAYRTYQVTPRIAAQIVQRQARLGDHVSEGQSLVTLSSVEMAQAQGELLVADREWRRVRSLGRQVVGDSRYIETQVTRQQAYAKVLAYGMTEAQAAALLKQSDAAQAAGTFELPAPAEGVVIRDDFVVGELAEPGRVLLELTDDSLVWVEARVTDAEAKQVAVDAPVRIGANGGWLEGSVVQIHPGLDESTRTLGVRIEVPNPDDILKPGQFVEARITGTEQAPVLAVPQTALMRSADGDWQVFVEEAPNRFVPMEVEVERTAEAYAVINGPPTGTRIATEGAFFLQSELAKAGFDIHAH